MKPQKIIIGENIKRIRKQKGFTQQDLADVLNVKRAAISKYEKGIVSPNSEQLWKIADALEIPIPMLIMRDISFPVPDPDAPLVSAKELKSGLQSIRDELSSLSGTVTECFGEEILIQNYNKLNSKGRQKAIEYVTDLSEQEKYTVPDDVE